MEKNNIILEDTDMTKAELRRFIKRMLDKEIRKENDKIKKATMSKEDIKKIVKDIHLIKVGQKLNTKFYKGSISSQVKKIFK